MDFLSVVVVTDPVPATVVGFMTFRPNCDKGVSHSCRLEGESVQIDDITASK